MPHDFPLIPLVVTLLTLGLFASIEKSDASITRESVAQLAPIEGEWEVKDGRARLTLSRCKSGVCNEISWLQTPFDADGMPVRDARNADLAMRDRPIMGLSILRDMQPGRENTWTGKVYDPEIGREFTAYLKPLDKNRLQLKGCIGTTKLCRQFVWHRVQ